MVRGQENRAVASLSFQKKGKPTAENLQHNLQKNKSHGEHNKIYGITKQATCISQLLHCALIQTIF